MGQRSLAATVHRVTKSQTQLSAHTHQNNKKNLLFKIASSIINNINIYRCAKYIVNF